MREISLRRFYDLRNPFVDHRIVGVSGHISDLAIQQKLGLRTKWRCGPSGNCAGSIIDHGSCITDQLERALRYEGI